MPPSPPPPSPMPPAPVEDVIQVVVPSVLIALTAFGPSLDADLTDALQSVPDAMARALGTHPSFVTIQLVEYALQTTFALPGAPASVSQVSAAVAAAMSSITVARARACACWASPRTAPRGVGGAC
jgi:hypothetical protein